MCVCEIAGDLKRLQVRCHSKGLAVLRVTLNQSSLKFTAIMQASVSPVLGEYVSPAAEHVSLYLVLKFFFVCF